MYLLLQGIHDLIVCIRCLSWNFYIKDKICSGCSFDHTKIMNAECLIQVMDNFFHLVLHRQDFPVICYDRIHMDGR